MCLVRLLRNLRTSRLQPWKYISKDTVPNNFVVCHTCDKPYCVNPYHLFLGEVKDNVQDAANKQRHAHGENNGQSKLTEDQVKEIRQFFIEGKYTKKQLTKVFCISRSVIHDIVTYNSWKHIK